MSSELQQSSGRSAAQFGQIPTRRWNFEVEQLGRCPLMIGQACGKGRSALHPTVSKMNVPFSNLSEIPQPSAQINKYGAGALQIRYAGALTFSPDGVLWGKRRSHPRCFLM